MTDLLSIEKLRKLIDTDPSLFTLLTGKKPAGRPKGKKNANTIVPGQELQIVSSPEVVNNEQPREISVTEAKRILQASKKPKNYTEEQRAVMLSNLQKGRAILQEKKKQKYEDNLIQAARKAEEAQKTTVIKKFVIKKRNINETKPEPESSKYQIDSDESDEELLKKLKHKEEIIQKINNIQSNILPKSMPIQRPVKSYLSPFY
jgi:transcriptional regulator of acetoin/glycerol metabolism